MSVSIKPETMSNFTCVCVCLMSFHMKNPRRDQSKRSNHSDLSRYTIRVLGDSLRYTASNDVTQSFSLLDSP